MISNKFPTKDISQEDLKTKLKLASKKNEKSHIVKIKKNIFFSKETLPIIAGPNTLENESLILKCCELMEKLNLKFLRGAIYKPLTFPYRSKKYFELGDKGIKILEKIKKNFDVIIVTEILEKEKLEALRDVVDIYQIGSRNMQNFNLIQDVAKTKKPMILKRHYGASLRDLMASAEYALHAGNQKIILCERGVSIPHTHKDTSRFALDLQAIPALNEYCKLPVISDPSHACFWHRWVPQLAEASVSVGADGLIIEFHPDPRNSAVDPLQAINFKQFKNLVERVKILAEFYGRKIL